MKKQNILAELESMLPKDRIERAKKQAEQDILQIKLSELRKKMGVKQTQIHSFSQSGISKLEARKDMKISTLVEYLDNIGMGLEIIAYPKRNHKTKDEVVLLKS
jgi:hypothetical protein